MAAPASIVIMRPIGLGMSGNLSGLDTPRLLLTSTKHFIVIDHIGGTAAHLLFQLHLAGAALCQCSLCPDAGGVMDITLADCECLHF